MSNLLKVGILLEGGYRIHKIKSRVGVTSEQGAGMEKKVQSGTYTRVIWERHLRERDVRSSVKGKGGMGTGSGSRLTRINEGRRAASKRCRRKTSCT
jgi:hypothetical protein